MKLALAVAFESLLERFPAMSLVDDGGAVEWDDEGFAGVVGRPVLL